MPLAGLRRLSVVSDFEYPAAERFVLGAQHGHFLDEIAVTLRRHLEFGAHRCRRRRFGVWSPLPGAFGVTPSKDLLAQIVVLVEEVRRRGPSSGDSNEDISWS